MIQLGPLELDSVTVEIPIGMKAGQYRVLSTGEEYELTAPVKTLRLRIRLYINDPVYNQLVELVRNYQIIALPLYSGYQHLDALYIIKSLRETPINWRWNEIEIALENVGHYMSKSQEHALRYDEWNTIYQEDFESFTAPMLNEVTFENKGSVIQCAESKPGDKYSRRAMVHVNATSTVYHTESPVVGNYYAELKATGRKRVLFGFDYWKNYHVSAWVHSNADQKFGLIWRAETGNIEGWTEQLDANTRSEHRGMHYELVVDPINNKYIVEYHTSWDSGENTVTTIYEEEHSALAYLQWYHLQVITIGNYHFCLVNGTMITYFRDTNCRGGRPGIMSRDTGNSSVFFDNVLVQEVPNSILILDESYSEPQGEIVKTRETLYGDIAYCEDQQISYKVGAGGPNCIVHLRFDQGYGEKVFDLSPYKHDARVVSGEWHNGFMRFSEGTDGLVIGYDADLAHDSEGTAIIRMRKHGMHSTNAAIIRRGTTDWSIFIDSNEELRSAAEQPGSVAADSAPQTNYSPLSPNYEWQTIVIRWKDSITRWEQFVDGVSAGADYSGIQSLYGTATSSDMVIGRANVDVEYIVIYNKWIEEPSIPGSTSTKILDVDSHHEDEVFDVRLDKPGPSDPDNYITREFWSCSSLTGTGTINYQDYDNDYDAKPLLFRRSGWHMATGSYFQITLPDHIKNRFHEMDWTIELIVNLACADSPSAATLLNIGNSAQSTRAIRIYGETVGGKYQTKYGFNTETYTGVIKEYDSGVCKGTQIIHLTHDASTRDIRGYFFGDMEVKATLGADINATTDTITVGGLEGVFYRCRIIGKKLRDNEIADLIAEYQQKPIQVFGEHEFVGYPEMKNGLISVKSIAVNVSGEDDEHGEKPYVELYDDGSFTQIRGMSNGEDEDHPIEIDNLINDDEGSNTDFKGNVHAVRLWEMQPIIRNVSHDEVTLECRNQFTIRNPQLIMSGSHCRRRIAMSSGIFGVDLHTKVTSRTLNWEQRYRYHDLESCWREGGHTPDEESSESNCRGNFFGAPGHAATVTMDTDASIDHLSNFTIFSSLLLRDYLMGLLPEHTDDFLYVTIPSYDLRIEDSYFDDLQKKVGGEFRVSAVFIPYSKTKQFDDPSTTGWTHDLTQAADGNCWNNLRLEGSGSASYAQAYKDISKDPGTWQVWWGLFGTGYGADARVSFAVSENDVEVPEIFRNYRKINYSLADNSLHLFHDMPFVLNGDSAVSLRFRITLEADENQNGTYRIDGLIMIPCYNGADFVLDQLYGMRALKQIRRSPT